jgi:hypothetical protein
LDLVADLPGLLARDVSMAFVMFLVIIRPLLWRQHSCPDLF